MGTLADAFVRIRPDVARFGPELKTNTEGAAGAAGTASGKKFGGSMLGAIGGVLAAGAVLSFFKGAFEEASESIKVGKLTEAVIKSTGAAAHITAGQVGDLATSLSNMSGVDDEVIQNAENVLLTFTRVRNEAGKGNDIFNQGAAAALNLSAALGTDLQSASVLVGKALNDPIGGLTALKKAGIQFTDQQKDQIKAMVAAGDTMGAQKIILGELTAEFGGAAAAAAAPADRARVAWSNFQEMIGLKLLPALAAILQWGLANQGWLVPLVGVFAALGVAVAAVSVATTVWTAAQSVAKVATAAWAAVQWVLDAAFLGFPLVWIIAAVLAVIAVVWLLIANWDTVIKWLGAAWDWLASKAHDVFFAIWHTIVDAWQNAVNFTRTLLQAMSDWVQARINDIMARVRLIIAVGQIFLDAFGRARDAVFQKVGELLAFVASIPSKIWGFLSGLGSSLYSLGSNMISGLISGIRAGAGRIKDALLSILPGPLRAFAGMLGISSPSKLFARYGMETVRGYVLGVQGQHASVMRAITSVVPQLPDVASRVTGSPDDAAGGTGALEALLQKIIDAVDRVAPGVGSEINGSVGVMRVLGRSL